MTKKLLRFRSTSPASGPPSNPVSTQPAGAEGLPSDKVDTLGLQLQWGSRALRESVEILSSMRFAISSLTVVCIASAIGTIVPQGSPEINYINQFGAFWSEVFTSADLFRVYNAPWFLLVMVLMLVSTSLCLVRNTPKMLREMKAWRSEVHERSFAAFSHRTERVFLPNDAGQGAQSLQALEANLVARGYQVRHRVGDSAAVPYLVAKKGSASRLGYIAAHLSIVVISLGGLADSELPTRLAMWWWGKEPIALAGLTAETIPEKARLPEATPTYRANLFIPEGQRSDLAVLNRPGGSVLLDLPFELELRQFIVDTYSTGMPKRFASDVILRDKKTGEETAAVIEVNKPLIHRGVAIYQSSFDDGGSQLAMRLIPLDGPSRSSAAIDLAVGESRPLMRAGQKSDLTLEISAFKAINVERVGAVPSGDANAFEQHVATVLSPAADATRDQQNVGPAFQYKLRDAAGQAREFHSYMFPLELDGHSVFVLGVRDTPDEAFRYLRIPADAQGSMDEFLRLRAAMQNPELRSRAAQRWAADQPVPSAEVRRALRASAEGALTTLANGGLIGMANMIEGNIPEDERSRMADVLIRIMTGSFFEVWQQARMADGLQRLSPADAANADFAQLALNAYSDSLLLDAPFMLQLKDFTEVKASVFQVTRSPGKYIVYLGSLLLVLGVFAMLYIHERRIWVWARTDADGAMSVRMAGSTPRKSFDFDDEFARLGTTLNQQGPTPQRG